MKRMPHLGLCLGLGVLAALFRFVYVFFPQFNVMDVLVFLSAATLAASLRPRHPWSGAVVLAVPGMMLATMSVSLVGLEALRNGVGSGHVVSAMLIPLSVASGTELGRRWGLRRAKRSEPGVRGA